MPPNPWFEHLPPNPLFQQLIVPFGVAFVVTMLFGPATISMLKKRGVGQRISEDGPASHQAKEGTPTMGGLIIVAGILAGALAYVLTATDGIVGMRAQDYPRMLAALALIVAYALLGMVDDLLTINPRNGVRGIASKPKAALQVVIAAAYVFLLGQPIFWMLPATWLMYFPEPILLLLSGALAVLYIVGFANFVNITDGLDGLASGLVAIASVGFCLTVFWAGGRWDSTLVAPLLVAAAGACAAFLWFNSNPAKVFMGDTGALALGVVLPVAALMAHREVLMVIVGLVFVVEGASVMLQWAVFKFTRITTGTGRRIFKKSPIHHHFEMCGWPEQQVVTRFWILGVVCAAVGFAGACWHLW